MAFKISNHISDYMQEHYPNTLAAVYGDDSGHMVTGLDALHFLLHTYEMRSQLGQRTTAYNVLCDFPNFGVYTRLQGVPTATHTCVVKLISLLHKEGLVDVIQSGNIEPNSTYVSTTLEYGSYALQEGKFTPEQAAKESPIQLATFMFELPDAAIDDLIQDYIVRVNPAKTSAYSNPSGTKNAARFSNHWNIDSRNKINTNNGEPFNDVWVHGEWDSKLKQYKYKNSHKIGTPNRSAKEKIAIVDRLIKTIYAGNKFAVLQLEQLKYTLQDDFPDD